MQANKRIFLLVLATFLITILMVFSGCSPDDIIEESPGEEAGDTEEGKEEIDEELKEFKEEFEVEITDHELSNLEGEFVNLPLDLEEQILVKFWQTQCPVCLEELPKVQSLKDKYADDPNKGIYTVNIMEDEDDIREFMEAEGYDFPVLFDTAGEVAQDYNVVGVPMTFVIDQEMEVQWFGIGKIAEDKMIDALESIN